MTVAKTERLHMPVLALRDVVVYPHMVIPLFVGRAKSIKCLDAAMEKEKQIFLVAQKDATLDDPKDTDLYQVGTVATILQLLKLPDGTVKVLVEGGKRAQLVEFTDTEDTFAAYVDLIPTPEMDSREQEVILRSAVNQFEGYIKLNKKIPPEVLTALSGIDDAARLADTMAAHMPLKVDDKQKVLEIIDVTERLEFLMAMMESEIDILQVERVFAAVLKSRWKKASASIT